MSAESKKLRKPDFIIGGAMKSATSSLHKILQRHDGIFMPTGEIHFFSMDDIVNHPDFFKFSQERISFRHKMSEKLGWYSSFFKDARDDQLLGEDSTVYLSSPRAPSRIKEVLPNVKLIFMIRNPVDRTYSHYWHLVGSGRAVNQFEQELQYGPSSLFNRSLYKKQIERFLKYFPREQVKIVLFERFVEDTQKVIDEICSYIGVSNSVNLEGMQKQYNSSSYPKWLKVYLALNYILLSLREKSIYDNHWVGNRNKKDDKSLFKKAIKSIAFCIREIVPKTNKYPNMEKDTRLKLESIYKRENSGIDKYVDVELCDYWPFMK